MSFFMTDTPKSVAGWRDWGNWHILSGMVEGIGIDIIELARIRKSYIRFGKRFVSRLLSTKEQERFATRRDKVHFLAGRFAVKEALIKSLGSMLKTKPAFTKIEIYSDEKGVPSVRLDKTLSDKLGDVIFKVSISHSDHSAVAMAIIERRK